MEERTLEELETILEEVGYDLAGNPIPNGRCTVEATLIVRDGI